MKIFQIVYSLSYGDGVGNDCIGINFLLKAAGYETEIYALYLDPKLKTLGAKEIKRLPHTQPEDIIIYHFSIGCDLNFWIANMRGIKILRYHNVTPAHYFEHYNQALQTACDYGRAALLYLSNKVNYCLPDSAYNEKDLRRHGYVCKMLKLPIIIPFSNYELNSDYELEQRMNDGKYNILFTGRIVPNKCQHDLIHIIYIYKKRYSQNVRLILVGSWHGMEKYHNELLEYAQKLNVCENVIFTGHVSSQQLLAYYRSASVFLCMSEHEGFCIPLVEAMYFQLPVIAYNCSAISETLGDGGIVFDRKDFEAIAQCLETLRTNCTLRENIIKKQKLQLKKYNFKESGGRLLDFIDTIKQR